jgi:hypothetical protein
MKTNKLSQGETKMFTQTKKQLQQSTDTLRRIFLKSQNKEKEMRKQMTKIATMIILAIGLTTSAAAQSQPTDPPIQLISLTGIESVRGIFEPLTNKFYGNSFVLNSFAESGTHHFTVSLDYSCALDYLGELCEASSHFPVTGGSWSDVVVRNNVYDGTLYGKVSGGAIDVVTNRNGEPGFRQIQINLQATGGMGRFAWGNSASISGVYEATTNARSNKTTGSVYFTNESHDKSVK